MDSKPYSPVHCYLAFFFQCQQPSNIIAQRKFSPARDPCSILWDVLWDDLGTMELTNRKKDSPKAPPSQLILYLHSRSLDSKENIRIIKCNPESKQALDVYLAIEHAMNTYGPNASKVYLFILCCYFTFICML